MSLLLLQLSTAYYLPGTYPQEFRVGDPLLGWSSEALQKTKTRLRYIHRPCSYLQSCKRVFICS